MVTLRQAAAAAAESHTLEGGINFGPRSLAAKGHTGTGRRAPTTNTTTTTNSALGVYVLLCPITGFWYVCVCVCVHTAVVSSLCVCALRWQYPRFMVSVIISAEVKVQTTCYVSGFPDVYAAFDDARILGPQAGASCPPPPPRRGGRIALE